MWEFLASALSAIPAAATNRFSLIAYTIAAAAYVFTVWRVQRNKNLLENLQKLSPKDRIGALEIEMGGVRLAAGISPEQWVRSRINKYYLVAFLSTCMVVIVVFALAVSVRNGSPLAGFTYVGTMTVIENQYQQFNGGKPLDDDSLKQKIAESVALAARHEFRRAIDIVKQLPESARVPAVLNNLGVAYAAVNDEANARAAFDEALKKSPDYSEARDNLSRLDERKIAAVDEVVSRVGDRESEPNNDILHANAVAMNTTVGAAIADPADSDYFTFKTPPKYRDLIDIGLENASTTLRPVITLFDAARSQLGANANDTPAGNVHYTFAATPDTVYYVQVAAHYAAIGAYRLSVKSLKAYDAFEPNDDIFHATPIQIAKPLQAGITDAGDVDYYMFESGQAGKFVAVLENRSTKLQPAITLFDKDRSRIAGAANDTASGNVRFAFMVSANSRYYVEVSPNYGSSGDYTLTVGPEQ